MLAVPGIVLQFSKGEVNRAGNRLAGRIAASPQELAEAKKVVQHFRGCHSYPLTKVTMGLRTMVATETQKDPVVAQRLKRFPQTVHKLRRHPQMELARMRDIGGCRALLGNEDEVRRVCDRLVRQWKVPDNRIQDYIRHPQQTGYRAIHLVTERDARQIEVQLRTPGQHAWAMNVERIAGKTNWALKDGEGPEPVLDFYRLAAKAISLQEAGHPPPPALLDRLERMRREVVMLMAEVT